MDQERLNQLMQDYIETNEYVGPVRDWHELPELDEDPEEDVEKTSPAPGDAHVLSPQMTGALRARKRRKVSPLPIEKGAGTYVCRPLLNDAELRAWAELYELPPLDQDLHVTLLHSQAGIPWTPDQATVDVPPWRFRGDSLGKLGDDGAIVLFFDSPELAERYRQAVADGATSTYDQFRPHLTLFYNKDYQPGHIPVPTFKLVLGGELAGHLDENVFQTVTKIDQAKRLVTGWAIVIENPDGTPHVDTQGDVLDEDELVQAAHAFITKRAAGEMHLKGPGGKDARIVGSIVESLVITKALKQMLKLPADTPVGWLITVKVEDDAAWKKVESGEYQAFSIGGQAIRELIS